MGSFPHFFFIFLIFFFFSSFFPRIIFFLSIFLNFLKNISHFQFFSRIQILGSDTFCNSVFVVTTVGNLSISTTGIESALPTQISFLCWVLKIAMLQWNCLVCSLFKSQKVIKQKYQFMMFVSCVAHSYIVKSLSCLNFAYFLRQTEIRDRYLIMWIRQDLWKLEEDSSVFITMY